jgi:Toprim domain-containing protein
MRSTFDEIAELNALELSRPAHMSYEEAARRLPDLVHGRATCPLCRHHRRTFSLRAFPNGDARPGCFACKKSPGEFVAALRQIKPGDGPVPEYQPVSDERRHAKARAIWRTSRPAEFTMAEEYLHFTRDIWLLPHCIKFNLSVWHPTLERHFPAMVAGVTDTAGNGVAVHCTFLERVNGRVEKLGTAPRWQAWLLEEALIGNQIDVEPRAFYGVVGGAAVRFPGSDSTRLVLGEGVETTLRAKLRALKAGFDWTAWSCLSANGIEACEIPDYIVQVFIAADNDENGVGQKAAEKKVKELEARGIKASWKMRPEPGKDYADD